MEGLFQPFDPLKGRFFFFFGCALLKRIRISIYGYCRVSDALDRRDAWIDPIEASLPVEKGNGPGTDVILAMLRCRGFNT